MNDAAASAARRVDRSEARAPPRLRSFGFPCDTDAAHFGARRHASITGERPARPSGAVDDQPAQDAPLDARVAGRWRGPPPAVLMHPARGCDEAPGHLFKIGPGVVETEHQSAGADPRKLV